ncbi:DUF3253 domain-containing protein [Mycobacterium paraterrae]|uniref:DUF3253 domain-containing protein n=1 Tax=Mycobacterium paraterrae TaxID=577492 RepID=A0ABY3VFB4_9MYCO|nr:DUF3253 domain-containing protein [Mycobacterium paraterrae]UMB68099.1 DUF3253 domain-containing protein [Mycobacterium paraterrae]
MSSDPHRELVSVAEGSGPGAASGKTALGSGSATARVRAAILALARHRGPGSSICPSDAARAVGGDRWRELTEPSRSIAFELARAGDVEITQRGAVVDPGQQPAGPIRIRVTSVDDS